MLGSESDATAMVRSKWVWVRDSLPLSYMPDEHDKETARDGERKSDCVTFSSVSSSLLSSFFSELCSCLCRLSTFSCRAWGKGETVSVVGWLTEKRKATRDLRGVVCTWRTVICAHLVTFEPAREAVQLGRQEQSRRTEPMREHSRRREVDRKEDRGTARRDAVCD